MKSSVSFTEKRVRELKAPETGRIDYSDGGCPGLILRVAAAGSRVYYFRRRTPDGKTSRIKIGPIEALSLSIARDKAREMTARTISGEDLGAERRAKREEPTLAELWTAWEQYAEDHKKQSSRDGDKWLYENCLKPWEKRRLSSIRHADIAKLHRTIGRERGHYLANRCLALIRSMFGLALKPSFGWKAAENPAAGIEKFKEQSRDRWLDGEELQRFFTALANEKNATIRDFILLLLLTGARRGNVQSMRWDDIHLEEGFWRIPDTKGGMPVMVPLTEPARLVLENRHAVANGPWVFPSPRSRCGHLMEPKGAWKALVQRAGLNDVRLHDLRRSMGSWMINNGSDRAIIGKLLGHKNQRTTEIYSHLALSPVRAGITAATDAMFAAAPGAKLLLDVESRPAVARPETDMLLDEHPIDAGALDEITAAWPSLTDDQKRRMLAIMREDAPRDAV